MKSRKKPLRDTLRENQRGLDAWAAAYGKPQSVQIAVKPKREIVNHTDATELEASVISEVSSLLAKHPSVLFAVRQNSGAAFLKGRDGKEMPVWFYKCITSPEKMRISDFWGILRDGRIFGFECKRRNWNKPTDTREFEQWAFLTMIANSGGIGRFVTCAEDVLEALKVVNPAQKVVNP